MTRIRSNLLIKVCAMGMVLEASPAATAAAPAGRYTVGTDTVLDTLTHLTWQRGAAPAPYSWSAAGTYCQTLSLGGFSAGWRLPAIKELDTLVDDSVSNPAIDSAAFPSTPATYFWSSSPGAYDTSSAWVVYFNDGNTTYGNVTNGHQVRCVR